MGFSRPEPRAFFRRLSRSAQVWPAKQWGVSRRWHIKAMHDQAQSQQQEELRCAFSIRLGGLRGGISALHAVAARQAAAVTGQGLKEQFITHNNYWMELSHVRYLRQQAAKNPQ
jgi:hypothetical protein